MEWYAYLAIGYFVFSTLYCIAELKKTNSVLNIFQKSEGSCFH